MKRATSFLLTLVLSTVVFANAELRPETPDPIRTPGEMCDTKDEDFREYRYGEKIPYCVRNVSSHLKSEIYDYYGVPKNVRENYTIDHFIPLSIGGNNSPANLWPEHYKIKELRQTLEAELYEAVREGQMTQADAVAQIIKAKMNPPLSKKSEYYKYKN
jgi:hypothetical protein